MSWWRPAITTWEEGSRSIPAAGSRQRGIRPARPGVAQVVELFEQLRGQSTNQVDGARIALAHNIGGPTAVSAVTILDAETPLIRRPVLYTPDGKVP